MRIAGYSNNYSITGNSTKLFKRPDVLAEIKRQQAELIKKTGYSKEQAHQDLMDDRQLARDQRQPSAAISADSQLIRLYGMDQIDSHKETTVIIINPPAKKVDSEVIEAESDVKVALEGTNNGSE